MLVDAASIFPHVVIADQTGHHANIVNGGTGVIAGKPEESGVTDAIVANGENAGVFTTNANDVGGMSIVTIDGDRRYCRGRGGRLKDPTLFVTFTPFHCPLGRKILLRH